MSMYAVKMTVLDDYKLIIEYDTGEYKFIDLKDIIFKYDCYKKLRDEEFFKQAFIDEFNDAPCWPNNLDMDPVEVYYMGVIISATDYRLAIARQIMKDHKELFERLAKL